MEAKIDEAVSFLESSHEGALATLEEGGPYVSAVCFLYDSPKASQSRFGRIYLFLSGLARHTKNIRKNPKASLLAAGGGPEPNYVKKRVTAQGEIRPVNDPARRKNFQERYIKIFPSSGQFFTLPDFCWFEMDISELHFIAGFGKIETFK